MGIRRQGKSQRAVLFHEFLETRCMLAGDCSAWQNPLDPNDLNDDGIVSPADALVAINSINGGSAGDLSLNMAPPSLRGIVKDAVADYLDATGDGHLSAADALAVINTLNEHRPGGPLEQLPDTDQQGDTLDDTDPAIGNLDLTHGFARTAAKINSAADIDVFKIEPTKENLQITLFSARRVALTVSLATVEASSTTAVVTVAEATTEAGSRHPAKINFEVDPDKTYYVLVQHAAAAGSEASGSAARDAGDDTAVYVLSVFNYSDDQFHPVTDSELGDDKHGQTPGDATPLTLRNDVHTQVRSNIDSAGDVDSFLVAVDNDSKLFVEADAEFPLTLEVIRVGDEAGAAVGGSGHVVTNVSKGTYMVSVKAANHEDIGAYRLNIVNAPVPHGIPHDKGSALEALFARADANDDGVVSKTEVSAVLPLDKIPVLDRIFNDWDADHNGQLDFAEFQAGVDQLHQRAPVHEPIRNLVGRFMRR